MDFVNMSLLHLIEFIVSVALFLRPENSYTPLFFLFIIVQAILALQNLQRNFYFCLRLTIPLLSVLFSAFVAESPETEILSSNKKSATLLV